MVALLQTIILSAVALTLFTGLMWLTLIILAPRIESPHLAPALKSLERLFCSGVDRSQYIFKLRSLFNSALEEMTRRLPAPKQSRRIDRH